jgi:hypothetical protein
MTKAGTVPLPKQVNGLDVITSEPVLSTFPTPNDPRPYKTVRRLLLEDGSTVYVCMECGTYTGPDPMSVIRHLKVHRRVERPKPEPESKPVPTPVPAPNSAHAAPEATAQSRRPTPALLTSAHRPAAKVSTPDQPRNPADAGGVAESAVRRLIDDRDEWRRRAERAELDLAELRDAVRAAQGRPPAPQPVRKTSLKPDVIEKARQRLQLLGELSRCELRAMTRLSTAQMDELTNLLVAEGVAEVSRENRPSGRPANLLRWVGK